MKSIRNRQARVDRRTTIKWLAATMVAANTGCSSNARFVGEEIPPVTGAYNTLLGIADTPVDIGYGTDPDLLNPVVPWARTMTDKQLETAAALCDLILPADDQSPAASAVGVPDFIDEWVSAPYEQQHRDREIIFAGLEWLEQQSRTRYDQSFAAADNNQATELLDDIAFNKNTTRDDLGTVEFFERFRFLTVGAFYTTEAGIADIGYIGNVAINGEYPGPSAAAMTHLAGVLDQLGLRLPS